MRRLAIAGAAVAVLLLANTAAAAASGWSIQKTPNSTNPTNRLIGVSCALASTCTAVGDEFNSITGEFTLAERWNGTKWSIQKTANPTGGEDNYLNGVSCASASACTAVGDYLSNGSDQMTLAERWNGTQWSIQQTPNPTGATNIYLYGVSCASTSACTAVGGYSTEGTTLVTLVERWNGTKWSIQQTPNPTGATNSELIGVSCASASACTAVGDYNNGGPSVMLVERWNGTKWSIQSAPDPTGGSNTTLQGASCFSAKACTAVGDYFNGTNQVTLVERWNGTKWSIQKTSNPIGGKYNYLNGVSCASATSCTASGDSSNGTADVTLAERWNGTKWSIQKTPNPTGASNSELQGTSCASASACTAVGDYNTLTDTLAERWTP